MSAPIMDIKCGVNSYPWGKAGRESIAARLCEAGKGYSGDDGAESQFKIDDHRPYAEMWMGDYPDLPSYDRTSNKSLKDLVEIDPEGWLGKLTSKKFDNHDIPTHQRKDSDNFTDPNHKLEIALALGKFEAFCGFKPLDRIAKLLDKPGLQESLPTGGLDKFDDKILNNVVNKMLKADGAAVKQAYTAVTNTAGDGWGSEDSYIPGLAPRLADQYSEADSGTLVALIAMNYLVLEAGNSIYIPADGIHAYLAGDIIECMARSNNVLNTGFYPRAERNSADLFCDTLTFKPHSPEECKLKPKEASSKTNVYSPPLSEFDASETNLKPSEMDSLASVAGSRTVIATKGKGELKVSGHAVKFTEGQTFFVKAGNGLDIEAADDVQIHTFYNN